MKKTNMRWLSLLAVVVLVMSALVPVAFAEDDALEIVEVESGKVDMDIMTAPILISPNPFSATTEAGYIPDGMVTEPAFEVEIVDDLVKELPQDIIEIEIEGVVEDAVEAGTKIEEMIENAPETAATSENKMIFVPENFLKNLNYMAVGMVGIFIVIGVIILAVAALNKVTSPRKRDQ